MGTFAKNFHDAGLMFITDTVLDWQFLFQDQACAKIMMDSLSFCIEHNRIALYCYVLMPNHYHLIISMKNEHKIQEFLRDFNKFTSQRLLFYLKDTKPEKLSKHYIGTRKQKYKIWRRDVDIKNVLTPEYLLQKAEYIHNNPLSQRWQDILKLEYSWDYPYSSARFYLRGIEDSFAHLSDFRLLL